MENRSELRSSKLFHISSADRTLESKSQYDFVCHSNDYFLHQIRRIIVKAITMPNTGYNVNSYYNTITYDTGGGDLSVTIPVGNYGNLTDLFDAVVVAFGAAGVPIVVTYVTDALTLKTTLTFAVPVTLHASSTASHIIGMDQKVDTASLAVQILPAIPDLAGLKKVYIASHRLSSSAAMITSESEPQFNVLTEIEMDVGYTFVAHRTIDVLNASDEMTSADPINVSSVDIQLYDERLNPVDLNGHDFWITLKVFQ